MPAPTPQLLTQNTLAAYSGATSLYATGYLDLFFGALSSAWQTWQDGLSNENILVNGTPPWTGSGGKLNGALLQVPPFSFAANSVYQQVFQKALFDATTEEFENWRKTFTFVAVTYAGSSSATGTSPGSADAVNISLPIGTAGAGSLPSKIHQLTLANLKPPHFDLTRPEAKAGDFAKALATGIETTFTMWLATVLFSGDIFDGAVGPGGAAAGIPSKGTGKIV